MTSLEVLDFENFDQSIISLNANTLDYMLQDLEKIRQIRLVGMSKIDFDAMRSLSCALEVVLRHFPENLIVLSLSDLGWQTEQGEEILAALDDSEIFRLFKLDLWWQMSIY